MDVAWSMPQLYVVDDEVESPTNNADTWPRAVGDNVTASVPPHDSYLGLIEHQHPSYQPEHHYPSFVRRRFMIVEDLDDSSVIAVAGSNGVIVAWNASSLLSAQSSNSNSRNSMASPHQISSSTATFGQHEASFHAHSRAVNRLAWHPTGRRPYLLLTASQDGSVKLWDRRASSSLSVHADSISSIGSNLSLAQPMTKNWFGFGGFGALSSQAVQNVQLPTLSEPPRTATWHCISTYQPKCEAVKDICWNPLIDDSESLISIQYL
jgi:WD40 repeat protein